MVLLSGIGDSGVTSGAALCGFSREKGRLVIALRCRWVPNCRGVGKSQAFELFVFEGFFICKSTQQNFKGVLNRGVVCFLSQHLTGGVFFFKKPN